MLQSSDDYRRVGIELKSILLDVVQINGAIRYYFGKMFGGKQYI